LVLVVQVAQFASAVQAVVLLGQTLPQSAALVHAAPPIVHFPPVVCSGQSLSTEHCWVVRLPEEFLHSA
jgi:hypothetical protein